jgi:intracellular multiplication protein IcmL
MAHQAYMGGGGYTVLLFAFACSLITSIGLVALNYYQFSHRPQPQYAATTPNGQVVPIELGSTAMLTPSQLLNWAERAILASNTFGFTDYQKQLTNASRYFSVGGWDAFTQNPQQIARLQQVIDNKININAVATAPPVLIDQMVINGRWLYLIEMPIMVQYVFDPGPQTFYYNVTIRVQREQDTWAYPKGVSVVNYRIAPGINPHTTGNL